MKRKKWRELSPRTRKIVGAAAAVEAVLKAAAFADLVKRPASQVRGPKPIWAVAIMFVNSAGLVPIVYFVRGRRDG